MNTDTGHWNGHFYVPTEKGFITACGIKGGYVALDPEKDDIIECVECRAMLTCTEGWHDGERLLREGFTETPTGTRSSSSR
jgi:hypothetical protein